MHSVAVYQMTVIYIIKRQTLNDGKTAVILVHVENFNNSLFPSLDVKSTGLKLVF